MPSMQCPSCGRYCSSEPLTWGYLKGSIWMYSKEMQCKSCGTIFPVDHMHESAINAHIIQEPLLIERPLVRTTT